MKKSLYLSAIAFMLAGTVLTGCSDFLDADNKSNIDADEYFATEQGYAELAVSAYSSLRNIYGSDPVMFCAGTDLYDNGVNNIVSQALHSYSSLTQDETNVTSFYQNCYKGIEYVNGLEYYYRAGNANADKLRDEGRFIRAYYYYLLSQQFGGVPIKKNYTTSVETGIAKSSQEEVYEYIIGQLKGIIEDANLPETDNTGRVSLRAVYNLLAKTYLAYAWDKGVTATDDGIAEGQAATVTEDGKALFEQAAQYAEKAIGNGITMTSFSDMWDVKNDNNADIIFAIQYTRGITGQDEQTDGNKQMSYFSNAYDKDDNLCKNGAATYCPSVKMLYLYEEGDERFEGTFMTELAHKYHIYYTEGLKADTEITGYYPAWYQNLSTEALTAWTTERAGRANAKIYSSTNPSVYIYTTTSRGKTTIKSGTQNYSESQKANKASLCVRKFDDYNSIFNGTSAVSFHNIVLAHVTETYLLAAEAYYMAGQSDKALDCVNKVRSRAKATELTDWNSYVRHYSDGTSNSYNSGSGIDNVPKITGADLDPIDIILDERARELCGEYYRWMDLRRTKRLIDYNVKYNQSVTDASNFKGRDGFNKWFRPIPNMAIKSNDQMDSDSQNQGYKSN